MDCLLTALACINDGQCLQDLKLAPLNKCLKLVSFLRPAGVVANISWFVKKKKKACEKATLLLP